VQGIQGASGSGSTSVQSTRQQIITTTGVLTNNQITFVDLNAYKGYFLYKIQTSHSAWVRLYVSIAERLSDQNRNQTEDPATGIGLITEVITTGSTPVIIAPAVIGYNDETPPTSNIPITIKNLSGSNQDITITLTLVQVEA
ncbi:hypothetical protein EB118_23720, partial [bacterium]|nr:hypothetical protein [bacterium]